MSSSLFSPGGRINAPPGWKPDDRGWTPSKVRQLGWPSKLRQPPTPPAPHDDEVVVVYWFWLFLSGLGLFVAGALGMHAPPSEHIVSSFVSDLYVIFFGVLLVCAAFLGSATPNEDFAFIRQPFWQLLVIFISVNHAWGCALSLSVSDMDLEPAWWVGAITAFVMDGLLLYTHKNGV